MTWNVPSSGVPVAEAQCVPCKSNLNVIYWDEPTLLITAADDLKMYVLTYNQNPLEEVVVTIGAPIDDATLLIGALVLLQKNTTNTVRFVKAAGVDVDCAGSLTFYRDKSIVGLLSLKENTWSFGGDFGFE